MTWTIKRRLELLDLEKILHTLVNLNNSTNFLQNITDVIAIAKELAFSNIDTGEDSFIQFLKKEANKKEEK